VPRPLLAELTRSRKRANLTDLTSIALQVAIRVHQDGLLLQRLYFADEVHTRFSLVIYTCVSVWHTVTN
jgi:hypothetical protein